MELRTQPWCGTVQISRRSREIGSSVQEERAEWLSEAHRGPFPMDHGVKWDAMKADEDARHVKRERREEEKRKRAREGEETPSRVRNQTDGTRYASWCLTKEV